MTKPKSMSNSRRWSNFILHIHPRLVPEKALKFNLTFGLGGISALLFILLIITGLLLRFAYVPTPEKAYISIQELQNEKPFGQFIRNLHHWCATLFILSSFLHFLRIFFTGAYTKNRRSNWVLGICMLLIVIFSNFTGYLLPWDQLAYWAITVSLNMLTYFPVIGEWLNHIALQGTNVSASTLLFFYNWHTSILPLTLIILMSLHFWKIRKAGGIAIPGNNKGSTLKKVPVVPNLVAIEVTVGLFLIALVMVLAFLFDAPLGAEANPLITPNPSKAPWYFMGFQELVLHFHPLISVFLLPLTILAILFYLPHIKNIETNEGIWFSSPLGKRMALFAVIIAFILSSIYIVIDEYIISGNNSIQIGYYTFIALLAAIIATYRILLFKKITKAEAIQTLGVFIFTSFLTLTVIGIFFRGEGMKLIF